MATFTNKKYEHIPTTAEYYSFVESSVGSKDGIEILKDGVTYRVAQVKLTDELRSITINCIVQVKTKDLLGNDKWVFEREFKFVVDDLRYRVAATGQLVAREDEATIFNEDGSLKSAYRTNYQYCVEVYKLDILTKQLNMSGIIQLNIQDKIETILA